MGTILPVKQIYTITIYKLHISPASIMGLRNMNGNPWDFIIMVISGQRGVFNYWILVNDS